MRYRNVNYFSATAMIYKYRLQHTPITHQYLFVASNIDTVKACIHSIRIRWHVV